MHGRALNLWCTGALAWFVVLGGACEVGTPLDAVGVSQQSLQADGHLIAGSFRGEIVFGGGTRLRSSSAADTDIYVAKVTSQGVSQAFALASTAEDRVLDVRASEDHGLALLGVTRGELTLDGDLTVHGAANRQVLFLARYDADATRVEQRVIGAADQFVSARFESTGSLLLDCRGDTTIDGRAYPSGRLRVFPEQPLRVLQLTAAAAAACDPCVQGPPHGACTNAADDCAARVAQLDSYCVQVYWDEWCVLEAQEICSCGCAHAPDVQGAPLSASECACAEDICTFDSYCCTTRWDNVCVSEAAISRYCQ